MTLVVKSLRKLSTKEHSRSAHTIREGKENYLCPSRNLSMTEGSSYVGTWFELSENGFPWTVTSDNYNSTYPAVMVRLGRQRESSRVIMVDCVAVSIGPRIASAAAEITHKEE